MPFSLFGPAHLLALMVLGGLAVAFHRLGHRNSQPARWALGALLVLGVAAFVADRVLRGRFQPADLLPLHLCDMSIVLALWALAWPPQRRVATLLFFWTTTGTLLASLTPALCSHPSLLRFGSYFLLHGAVIWAAIYLVAAQGLTFGRREVLQAWGWTQVYGLLVLAVDLSTNANYMFLLRKPSAATLLDLFGPWPIYIVVVDGLALMLFAMVAALTRTTLRFSKAPAAFPAGYARDSA